MTQISRIAGLILLLASSGIADPDLAQEAQNELFAARYDHAAKLYRALIDQDSTRPAAYYGLVRALLRSRHSLDAYEAADLGLKNAPATAGALTAAGMAMYRRGDILKAQELFIAALQINPKYPGALVGLSQLDSAASKFKRAQALALEAYQNSPEDPALMLLHADTLKGAEHIAALEQILAIYDPKSPEARGLRSHIASDRALANRKLRRMTSPYESTRIKLIRLLDGPAHPRGVGLRVELNGKTSVKLLLDTGASGISLSPKTAEKAGLELVSDESTEMRGIGDERPQNSFHYIAPELGIGSVTFTEFPVSVYRSAKSSDFDGLIGADVFARFLITIDFPALELELEARPASSSEPPEETRKPAAGFYQAMRFGNHLALFTSTNAQPGRLFLVDSGSTVNLIDTSVALDASRVSDSRTTLTGIQGAVRKTAVAERITINFAGFRQDNPNMLAFNMDSMNDSMGVGLAGILGMPVLGQMRLTIDYRNGTLRMEHKK